MDNGPECMCKPGKVSMTSVSVDVADSPLVPSNERRRSLVVNAPLTNRITLTWDSIAVADSGIVLYPGQWPLVLSRHEHGAMVTQAMRAISDTAAQTVTFAEEIGVK